MPVSDGVHGCCAPAVTLAITTSSRREKLALMSSRRADAKSSARRNSYVIKDGMLAAAQCRHGAAK